MRVRPAADVARNARGGQRTAGPALFHGWFPEGAGDALVAHLGQFRQIAWSVPFVCFLLYMFVTVTYTVPLGTVAMAGGLLGLLTLREQLRFPPFVLWVGAFVLWSAIGMATSRYPGAVQEEVVTLGKLWLILVVAVNCLRTRSQIRFFIVFFLFFFAAWPARGTILNYFVAGYSVFGRAVWNPETIFGNPNDLAVLALLQASMAAGIAVADRNRWFKLGAIAALVVLPVIILLTQSRAVFVGTCVVAMFGVLGHRNRLRMLAISATVAIVVGMTLPAAVWERLGTLSQIEGGDSLDAVADDGSAAERLRIWRTAVKIIGDHPGFGVGLGAYPMVNAQYAPRGAHGSGGLGAKDTHSTYLNVLAELGFPGLMLFGGILISVIVPAERIRRSCKRLMPSSAQQLLYLELGLLGFMVSAVWGSYARISFFYVHLALIWVFAESCRQDYVRLVQGPARVGHNTRMS